MANPKIEVELTADAKGLKKGAKEAGDAVDKLAKDADDAADKTEKAGKRFDAVGKNLDTITKNKASEHLGLIGDAADALGVDLDNVDSKMLAAGAGMAAVAGFAAQGVQKFTAYADEVRRVRTETNASWEQSSRLTASFKDLGLEVDNSAEMMGELARNIDDGKLAEFGIEAVKAKDGTIDLIGTLGNVADAMNRTVDPTRKSAMGAALFGEEWSQLAPLLTRGRSGIEELMGSVSDSQLVTKEAADQAREWQQSLRDAQKAVDNLQMAVGRQLLPQLTLMVKDLSRASGAIEKLSGEQAGLTDFMSAFNPVSSLYNARLRDQARQADEAAWASDGLADKLGNLAVGAADSARKAQDLADAEQEAADKASILKDRQEDVARSAQDAAKSVEEHRKQLDLLNGTVTTVVGTQLAYDSAVMSTDSSVRDLTTKANELTAAIDANGAGSAEATEAQRAYDQQLVSTKQAVDSQAKAAADLAKKTAEAAGQTFTAEQYNIVYRDSLVKVRDAATDGNLVGGLNGLIGLVDDTAASAGRASSQLNAAAAAAARLAAEAAGALAVTNSGQIVGSADRIESSLARATGGPVFAGQAYRVGEAGPEMFVPSDSGRVLSPAQVQQLANQALAGPAAGGEQVLVVNLHLDGKQVDQALVRPAELRRRAGS